MKRSFVLAVILLCCAARSALAIDAPSVPSTAKKMTSVEIKELYDGKTGHYENFMFKEANAGTFSYDFKAKTVGGTYKMGADAGNWKGTFSPGKDQICIKVDGQPKNCFFMFRDGDGTPLVPPTQWHLRWRHEV